MCHWLYWYYYASSRANKDHISITCHGLVFIFISENVYGAFILCENTVRSVICSIYPFDIDCVAMDFGILYVTKYISYISCLKIPWIYSCIGPEGGDIAHRFMFKEALKGLCYSYNFFPPFLPKKTPVKFNQGLSIWPLSFLDFWCIVSHCYYMIFFISQFSWAEIQI